jgi:nitrile hydratase accessory protein
LSERLDQILPAEGASAPPRANGELVFSEPWESRIFGVTLVLYEADRFEWPEFQQRLIAAIARQDSQGESHYWAAWLEAFRDLGEAKGWLSGGELDELERTLAARPAGHDH